MQSPGQLGLKILGLPAKPPQIVVSYEIKHHFMGIGCKVEDCIEMTETWEAMLLLYKLGGKRHEMNDDQQGSAICSRPPLSGKGHPGNVRQVRARQYSYLEAKLCET